MSEPVVVGVVWRQLSELAPHGGVGLMGCNPPHELLTGEPLRSSAEWLQDGHRPPVDGDR